MSSALSPKRLARNAAATLAGLAGAKPRHSEAKSQSEPGGSPEPPQPPTRLAKPSGRLSAAELLGGGAQSERNTPFDDASRASEAPPSGQGEDPTPTATGDAGPAEAGPPDPQPPETAAPQPAKSEAAAQTAQDDPAPEQEEGPAISGNLYDTLRTAKPNAEGQAQHRRSDASELRNEEAGAEAKSAADETPETPDAQDNEDADAVSAADDDVEDERAADDGEPYSETEKGEASQAEAADKPTTGNGRDHGEDGEDADSSSSLLDRLKQVPENQTR